jgi:sulfite dehydrogenase
MRIAAALAFLALAASTSELKIQLPQETASLKPGPGVELANSRCLVCHSADYISTQPPMPAAFWKSTALKMRDKYGAELPDTDVEPVVAYLTSAYGTGAAAAPAAPAPAAAPGRSGPELAEAYRCTSCHSVERHRTGPAFKDVAKKYAGRSDGPKRVERQIRKGGSGQWGTIPMPKFPDIPKRDVDTLTAWILGLR